jgi:glycine cleavage system transcriptional repressor
MSKHSAAKTSQLVLSALGEDKPGIIDELSRCVLTCGCNIVDSRMTVLGGDFAILLLVDGNWNNIAKLENQIALLEERLALTMIARRTVPKEGARTSCPTGGRGRAGPAGHRPQPGQLLCQAADQHSKCPPAMPPRTGTPMFSVHLTVDIPATLQIAMLRDEFMDFCDQLNLDAVIEPIKG